MQIGMIGLGRMGANMVRRLQRAGHTCVVHDRSPDAIAAKGDRLAAVLLPLVEDDRLVFTRRAEHLSRHPGEISFPGGLAHEGDADIVSLVGLIDAPPAQ